MTSFVEYHGHGFWCRNAVLRDWLRAVIAAAAADPLAPAWLRDACAYWDALACALKSNRTDVRFEVSVTTPDRQRACERLFAATAAGRLSPAVKRAALLSLSLIRGELAGAVPTVVDYWTDEEWLADE